MDAASPEPGAASGADEAERLRRRVLWSMPTGLYLLGSAAGSDGERERNLMTANLAVQVSTEPALVAVAVESGARTRALLDRGGVFSLSILRRRDRALVRRFVKPVADLEEAADGRVVAMAGQPVFEGVTGAPVLAAARGWIECRVHDVVPLGSHVLYIGEVVAAGGEGVEGRGPEEDAPLRMEDTRMHYGG